MELEQLKHIWTRETGPQNKKNEYLLSLLDKPSNSPISKMKRNLRAELMGVVILYSACVVYYLFAFHGRMIELSGVMLILGVLFVTYYYRKNKLLNNMQCVYCHVKSNLELQLGTLEKYVRFYLLAGTLAFPVTMIIVGYVTLILYPERLHTPETLLKSAHTQRIAFIYIATMLALSGAGYFLNKWYVNKLYGRHIKKLREILNEMSDD
ncbi:MAG TPA: hypothetical protein VEB42_15295 [Chitinophagaceae bacterium]|nr:hypothetical protein [Chitinophagaceae bacterium]